MSAPTVQQAMEEEARAFAAETGEGAPTPPEATHTKPEGAPTPSTPPVQDEAKPSPEAEPTKGTTEFAAQLAALAWGILDTFVPKWTGQRMKLQPEEMERLVSLSTPVIAKRLPQTDGALTDEELLLGCVAFTYAPKFLSPEPVAKPASPAGGGESAAGNSGTPTDASVDGRKVEAQVLA